MQETSSYAVIFKAFAMDRFVERQLARLRDMVGAGDIYLMLDETSGPAGPAAFARVIRYDEADLTSRGFADYGEGALFWYNADYPLYHFQHLHPEYDVVVMVEYDVVVQINLDTLVRVFRERQLDLIAQPIDKPVDVYWWTPSMRRFYQDEQIRPYLICFSVFSGRAIRHLAACRLAQGREPVTDSQWPVGECFVATELSLRQFRIETLAASGPLTRYDWWPPIHESELPDRAQEVVLHPVLSGRRYMKSLFKNGYRTGCVTIWRLNLAAVLVRGIWRGLRGRSPARS
ncbi:hypothetical protein [Acidocella sp.]|uniref:hypothetical protein n=1 Tax=Acidocella sp. TaxID=50710 RepID=UPI00261F481F|nr:hypothetical protein [Acidocella sp.]